MSFFAIGIIASLAADDSESANRRPSVQSISPLMSEDELRRIFGKMWFMHNNTRENNFSMILGENMFIELNSRWMLKLVS